MPLYFAYGSNISAEAMARRCPRSKALNLARLARPVKKMIGGVVGWKDEGFSLTSESDL